jgi:hypothetical protein
MKSIATITHPIISQILTKDIGFYLLEELAVYN